MSTIEKTCGQCALKAIKGGICPIFNEDMSGKSGCPYFTKELKPCDACGSHIIGDLTFVVENDKAHQICTNCLAQPCAICATYENCRFDTDQSCPEPLYIMVQQRQGNAIIQSQQLNPKRIDATCAQGCPCYNPEGKADGLFCYRKLNLRCERYKINWRN